MNWPTPARLRDVVVPYSASAPNISAHTAKVLATDAPVYASRTSDRVTPLSAEYPRNSAEAVPGASCATRADRVEDEREFAADQRKEQQLVRYQRVHDLRRAGHTEGHHCRHAEADAHPAVHGAQEGGDALCRGNGRYPVCRPRIVGIHGYCTSSEVERCQCRGPGPRYPVGRALRVCEKIDLRPRTSDLRVRKAWIFPEARGPMSEAQTKTSQTLRP